MLKLLSKQEEGRGFFAPVLPRPKLLSRLVRNGRGSLLSAGAGVLAAAVVVVSLLTWLAPDSDRPVPLELVDRVLPGVAEQVEEQAAALIEGGKEAIQSAAQNVREGMVGAGLRAAQDAIPGSSPVLFPAVLPTPSSMPTSSPSSEEPPAPSEPSIPSTEAPPATSEPVTPVPIVEEPPPPAVDEPAPPTEEPAPPAAEEPPPVTEEPPPATGESPPVTEVPST